MPISGVASLTISFSDISSPDVTSWLWLFGDGDTSNSQNPTHTYTDDGDYVVSLIATSPLGDLTFQDVVHVGSEVAEWTQPVPAYATYPGTDPQVLLRISNDAGRTWVSEQLRPAGKVGEYHRRVRWNRLGSGRRRVFEVVVTDPVAWNVVGAYLKAEPEK